MSSLGRVVGGIVLIYVLVGMVYSLAGYAHRALTGKEEVFSPLIGIPMDVIGWPWMVCGDLKLGSTAGLKPQAVSALVSIAVIVIVFAGRRLFLTRSTK